MTQKERPDFTRMIPTGIGLMASRRALSRADQAPTKRARLQSIRKHPAPPKQDRANPGFRDENQK